MQEQAPMTIRTIVQEVIETRIFTAQQEELINSMVQRQQFTADDMRTLGDLIEALSQGVVWTVQD